MQTTDEPMSFGDFMRAVRDLFPNALVGNEDDDPDGQLVIYTGLREVHDEGGNATVEPIKEPNLTGV